MTIVQNGRPATGSADADHPLARQLPGWAYADERLFGQEMSTIFARSWQYAGRHERVPEPGDYFTTQVARDPIIVLRAPDGTLQAFHNVCPHRGMRLLDGDGRCKRIVCPYHAWSFNHDGALHHIPKRREYFPGVEDDAVALQPASVAVWRGFVFVNPDPDAEPLLSYLADFPAFLDQHHEPYEDLVEIATFRFDEPVNWKLLVENYVEDYHFGFVHPGTLKVFDFENVKTMPTGPHCRVLMPYRARPPEGHCKYAWDASGPSYQGYIFPGTTVQTAKNHMSLFRFVPISAQRTLIEIPILQTPAQMLEYPVDLAELEIDVTNDMEEDFVICRALQSNVASRAYRVNAVALEHELGVAHFQRMWRQYMGDGGEH
jgi:phenylpropionate dioxygenase-like ring-hydroxylating dioxygenase large terminal subunit